MDNTSRINRCLKFISIILLLTIVKGSMITNLYSLQDCDIPKRRYDAENQVKHRMVLYSDHGKKLINFSMVVPHVTLPFTINLRGFHVRKSAKVAEVSVGNLTCRNVVVAGLLELIQQSSGRRLKYSKEQCKGYKDHFSFYQMPASEIIKYWQFTRSRIGRYIFEFEFVTQRGVIMCFGATMEIK